MFVYTSSNQITHPSGIFSNILSSSQIWEMHLHDDYYEIMLIFSGKLIHEAEGAVRELVPGDVVFLPQGTTHSLYSVSNDLVFLNLAILPTIFWQAAGYLDLRTVPQRIIFSHVNGEILGYLQHIYATLEHRSNPTRETCTERSVLAMLLPYCCDMAYTADWFEELISQMRKRENFQVGINRMQQLAFCSPSHLSRTCRNRLGMTPTQFVEKTRIEYAAQLLRYTDYSIRDVGIECGFTNHGYFYRCFEHVTGLSPGQYRARNSRPDGGGTDSERI